MKKFLIPAVLIFIQCSTPDDKKAISLKADLAEIIPEEPIAAAEQSSLPPSPNRETADDKIVSTVPTSSATGRQQSSQNITGISKKIIKNGQIRIQVSDLPKVSQQVSDMIKKNNAYLQKESFSNTDMDETLNLTIRVPHQHFDALISSFSDGIGSVLSKNVDSDDVTEKYTDVSIKLANKKIYLEKYRDMLKSAKTTKDILEIQENIRELEDEIDVSEGTLRYIDDRVNYSTLELSLYKEKVRSSATSEIGFGSRFGNSLTEGWNTFIAFLLGVISLWPFALLFPIAVFLWRKWKKRKKQ